MSDEFTNYSFEVGAFLYCLDLTTWSKASGYADMNLCFTTFLSTSLVSAQLFFDMLFIRSKKICSSWASQGSVKLIFTKLVNLVSLEQLHHKPVGMCCGGDPYLPRGPLRLTIPWASTSLQASKHVVLDCSDGL